MKTTLTQKNYEGFCKDLKCPEYEDNVGIMYLSKVKGEFSCGFGQDGYRYECLVIDIDGNLHVNSHCYDYYKFIVNEFKVLCAKIKHRI